MRLIAVTGRAGVGKDALIRGLVDELSYVYDLHVYRFADPLKRGLETMFGWPPSIWDDRLTKETVLDWLGVSPRYLAQTIGTEWGRDTIHPDLWVMLAEQAYWRFKDAESVRDGIMLIPDCRFDNEAEWLSTVNGIVLEVTRGSPDISESSHSSESGIADRYVTHSINNDGTIDDLVVKAIKTCGL